MKNPHKRANLLKMPSRTVDREAELVRIEREAIANFSGQLDNLAGALGMLRMGDHFGWRVLVLIHNKRTIRKYEDILDINIRQFFDPEGSQSSRSMGYNVAKGLGNFWKAVSGDLKVENRREISQKPQ